MNTSDVLYLAADLLDEKGWQRGDGWLISDVDDQPPGLCLEGAIQAASGMPAVLSVEAGNLSFEINHTCPAGRAVRAYLADQHTGSLFLWNDRAARTQDRVIEVLRATALIEAAREDAALLAEAGRSA